MPIGSSRGQQSWPRRRAASNASERPLDGSAAQRPINPTLRVRISWAPFCLSWRRGCQIRAHRFDKLAKRVWTPQAPRRGELAQRVSQSHPSGQDLVGPFLYPGGEGVIFEPIVSSRGQRSWPRRRAASIARERPLDGSDAKRPINPTFIQRRSEKRCQTRGLTPFFIVWRRGWDSNPRRALTLAGFQDQCIQPLCHLSGAAGCAL